MPWIFCLISLFRRASRFIAFWRYCKKVILRAEGAILESVPFLLFALFAGLGWLWSNRTTWICSACLSSQEFCPWCLVKTWLSIDVMWNQGLRHWLPATGAQTSKLSKVVWRVRKRSFFGEAPPKCFSKTMGAKTNGDQNTDFSKWLKLAILRTIRFDTPLGAAKETLKRVPKQMGTKMPSKHKKTCHFENHLLWYPFGFCLNFRPAGELVSPHYDPVLHRCKPLLHQCNRRLVHIRKITFHLRPLLALFRKRQFVHIVLVHNFVPVNLPPQPAKWWISSWICKEQNCGHSATIANKQNTQNCEQTLPELRTISVVAEKVAFLIQKCFLSGNGNF